MALADLVTISELKQHLLIEETDVTNDIFLQGLILQASDLIRVWTRHNWAVEVSIIEKFTPVQNTIELQLKRFPITSIIVVEDGVTIVEDTDYFIEADIGIVRRQRGTFFIEKDHAIVITYTAGKVPPEGLKLLVIEWISSVSRINTKTFTTNEGIEDSITISTIPAWVTTRMDQYKKWNF